MSAFAADEATGAGTFDLARTEGGGTNDTLRNLRAALALGWRVGRTGPTAPGLHLHRGAADRLAAPPVVMVQIIGGSANSDVRTFVVLAARCGRCSWPGSRVRRGPRSRTASATGCSSTSTSARRRSSCCSSVAAGRASRPGRCGPSSRSCSPSSSSASGSTSRPSTGRCSAPASCSGSSRSSRWACCSRPSASRRARRAGPPRCLRRGHVPGAASCSRWLPAPVLQVVGLINPITWWIAGSASRSCRTGHRRSAVPVRCGQLSPVLPRPMVR